MSNTTTMKRIPRNPSKDRIRNFLTVTNAIAKQQLESGRPTEFLSEEKAPKIFGEIMKMAIAANDIGHEKHSLAIQSIKNAFPNAFRDAMETFAGIGEKVSDQVKGIAESFVKNGMPIEKAVTEAFNTLAGNPVYDHFGNLNLLSAQLYEEQAFVNSFIDMGDAFNMPIDTMASMSRFRSPSERISGSGKTYQGDLNSQGFIQNDSSRIKIDLFNEFKNVKWLYEGVDISSDEMENIAMYEKSVAPALAGFLIQQRLIDAAQKVIMKQAELIMVGGLDHANNYIPGVGGSYGLLSSNILLAKSDAGDATPTPVSASEWEANPTKLIQKITNYYFKPASVSAPLPIGDSALLYKEIVRLISLYVVQNVDLQAKEIVLFVPTTWYSQAMQYPTGGTFNKQLQEMVMTATNGKLVSKIRIEPSSLMNYGANIGTTTNAYNYITLIAMGSPVEKKAVVMPGQTTIPIVVSLPSNAALLSFQVKYATGGAMVKQYGGVYVLEFSVQA